MIMMMIIIIIIIIIILGDVTLHEESSYVNNNNNNNNNQNYNRKLSNLVFQDIILNFLGRQNQGTEISFWLVYFGAEIRIENDGMLIKLYVNHSVHYNQ
jgi:hypothetical protein